MSRILLRVGLCSLVLAFPAAGQAEAPAGPAVEREQVLHVLQRGETIYELARRFLVGSGAMRTVQALNAIADPHRISTGFPLRVPFALLRAEPLVARVIATSGTARIEVGDKVLPVVPGAQVPQGAVVETGANGFVTLGLPNGSRTALPTATRLRIDHLRRFMLTGSIDYDFTVERGKVETQATPLGADGNSRFRIRTPLAVAAVRGTRFRVGLAEAASLAEVLEGTVAAGGGGGALEAVPHGFGAVVDARSMRREALLPAPELLAPGKVQVEPLVTLALDPVAGAAAYHVQVGADAGFANVIAETRATAPALNFSGIPNGNLFIRVSAIAGSGLEGLSQTFAMRRVLTGLSASAAADGNAMKFAWDGAGEGRRSYRFQLAQDDKGALPLVDEVGLTEQGVTLKALPPGVYYWRVGVRQVSGGEVTENWLPFEKFTIAAPGR